jgi:hypothetical protein
MNAGNQHILSAKRMPSLVSGGVASKRAKLGVVGGGA